MNANGEQIEAASPASSRARLSDEGRARLHTLCEQVVGATYEVSNTLGAGFLEKVYEQALLRELALRGVSAELQVPIPVLYKGARIGLYFADMLVEGDLIVELKCVEAFTEEHLAQCLNYLKGTGLRMCLLVNFQHPKVRWQRIVHNF